MFSETKNILRPQISIIAIVLFSLAFNFNVNGQVVDSLLNLLVKENLHDTSRVSVLNKLSLEYNRLDLEKSLYYAQKADTLSSKISFTIGKAESLRNIGTYHMRKADYNKAKEMFYIASQLFEQAKNIEGKANCLISMGATYNQEGDYDLALEQYQKSLNLWLSLEKLNKERVAAIYNNMGIIYRIQGNYPKSLEHYQESLLLKEEIGDKAGMSDTYNNMGVIFRVQNDYPKALDFYFKSLEIRQDIGFVRGIASNYNNIGIVYSEMGDYSSALEYYRESLNIRMGIDDKIGVAHIYNNIGDAYQKNNELLLSHEFYQKGLNISIEIGRKPTQAYCLLGLGEVMLKQSNPKKAYYYSQQAYELANEIGDITIIKKVTGLLSEITAELGLYKSAYQFLSKHKAMSDSIQNQEVTKKIIGLEYEYIYQKGRIEQEKRDVEQQVRYAKQRQMTILFIFGFSLAVVLITLVLFSYRRKQRDYRIISLQKVEIEHKNDLLEQQKEEIESQNETLQQWNREVTAQNEKINNQKILLEEQAVKLKELDEIKSRFFTNISHEFRTPLTLIIGPTEQLISQCSDQKIKSSLQLIQSNANNLLGLINQLLDISRIEKGIVKMQLTEGYINKEFSLITEMFSSQAVSKGVELEFISENDIYGFYDKEKLERIMYNLLSNAIKNTDEGKVSVSVARLEQQNRIRIIVADTGIGIEEKKLPFIFDRFYMANEAGRMGSGIGLAFTNELVKLYKGNIQVHSEVGKGTTFTVELPVSIQSFEPQDYEISSSENINLDTPVFQETELENNLEEESKGFDNDNDKKETVLLVEDHEELRKFIATNLADTYKVIEAENGRIGIEMALKIMPDLIVTDVMMPEVDGIELTQTLKNNRETSHIPIVMLTAKASEDSKIAGLETEADDYLTKPFSYRELKVRINNLLKIRRKLREKFMRSIEVNPSEITTNSLDETFLAKLLSVVEENLADSDFSVETLCEKAGVGRSTLHNKLKSLLDQSTTEFINTIRVKRAAQLIKQKAGSISEIAYDVGYNNLSYFTKQFKKHFGITPSEMLAK